MPRIQFTPPTTLSHPSINTPPFLSLSTPNPLPIRDGADHRRSREIALVRRWIAVEPGSNGGDAASGDADGALPGGDGGDAQELRGQRLRIRLLLPPHPVHIPRVRERHLCWLLAYLSILNRGRGGSAGCRRQPVQVLGGVPARSGDFFF